MTIRTLLVEDEPLALRRLRRLLRDEADVKVVGTCGDVPAARAAIATSNPDLLLLDVQLPGADGLSLLDGLPDGRRPAVIFVTAHDRYAVPAFGHEAVDYLLKPVDPERFRAALARARRRLARPERTENGAPLTRLLVRERGRAFFVRVDEVDWFEAADNPNFKYEPTTCPSQLNTIRRRLPRWISSLTSSSHCRPPFSMRFTGRNADHGIL